jgi:hypothetical protein
MLSLSSKINEFTVPVLNLIKFHTQAIYVIVDQGGVIFYKCYSMYMIQVIRRDIFMAQI